jgi:hypothetical protein
MRGRSEEVRIIGGAAWRLGSVANRARIAAKDFAEARERRRAALAGPTVAERQAELVGFYERFERFVELLCDAAQYGPNPRLERSYLEDREWVMERYVSLRPFVSAYLPPDEPDSFDRLLTAEDLNSFLAEDDGAVIFGITSAREALSRYAEHLRHLAARKSA